MFIGQSQEQFIRAARENLGHRVNTAPFTEKTLTVRCKCRRESLAQPRRSSDRSRTGAWRDSANHLATTVGGQGSMKSLAQARCLIAFVPSRLGFHRLLYFAAVCATRRRKIEAEVPSVMLHLLPCDHSILSWRGLFAGEAGDRRPSDPTPAHPSSELFR